MLGMVETHEDQVACIDRTVTWIDHTVTVIDREYTGVGACRCRLRCIAKVPVTDTVLPDSAIRGKIDVNRN